MAEPAWCDRVAGSIGIGATTRRQRRLVTGVVVVFAALITVAWFVLTFAESESGPIVVLAYAHHFVNMGGAAVSQVLQLIAALPELLLAASGVETPDPFAGAMWAFWIWIGTTIFVGAFVQGLVYAIAIAWLHHQWRTR